MLSKRSDCFSCVVTLCFFSVLTFFLDTFASPTLHKCLPDQRDALLEFKHEFLTVTTERFNLWNKSSDCCSWDEVICNAKSGQVISLEFNFISLNISLKPHSGLFKLQYLQNLTLFGCDLYGNIPSSLGNLSHLTHLGLGYNYGLVGEVPVSIGNLSHLTHLDLGYNYGLVGEVPISIRNLTQLRYLSLSHNKLSGDIFPSFVNLEKLSTLDISYNQFTSENISLVLGHLTSLSDVDISNNQIKSELPLNMSGFHNLEHFDISRNFFSGSVPISLFMIPSLISVRLSENRFKGPIEFGNTSSYSSKLDTLYLDQNNFDGVIPYSISRFLNLETLHFSKNNFTGRIPLSISKLVYLEDLDFSHNKLEGQVPSYLWNVSRLILSHNSFNSLETPLHVSNVYRLDLGSNSFRGPLPHWICKTRLLEIIDLSNNNFNGSIPQCQKKSISNLGELFMRNNNFSGTFPDIFVNAKWIGSVDVSNNQLEGKLPKSLINSKYMRLLNVGRNKIKDKFPSWLGSLPSLNVLILQRNKFYGSLYHPNQSNGQFESLKILGISQNHFTGTLPPFYFSSLHEMMIEGYVGEYMIERYQLYFSTDSHYHDSMEMVLKGVNTDFDKIRNDFKAIDFSENQLHGNIPESIGLLKGLILLNLSGNAFTSNIPQSLANLTNLESLDLSRNRLSGHIPQELANLSFLEIMNFSNNNLKGSNTTRNTVSTTKLFFV